MSRKKLVTHENAEQIIDELLDLIFWPEGVEVRHPYNVQTDDTDGREDYGWLTLYFSPDGDAWISATCDRGTPHEIRFRNAFGGSKHPMVRNAILILALAIRKEAEKD